MPALRTFRVRPKKELHAGTDQSYDKTFKVAGKKQTICRRRLKGQLKERDAKIAQLTAELGRLRKITEPEKAFNHCYPAQMIVLAVFIVVHAGGPLRCAAKTVAFFAKMMGWSSYTEPSPTTIRNWVIRCGYHALSYARDLKGDYVAIIESTFGRYKNKGGMRAISADVLKYRSVQSGNKLRVCPKRHGPRQLPGCRRLAKRQRLPQPLRPQENHGPRAKIRRVRALSG